MHNAYISKVTVATLLTLAILTRSNFADAATTTAASDAADTGSTSLDEVVIVARRIEERLQDVPISVTAISGETLRESSITTGSDLIKLVPSLNVQQQATTPDPNYSLRGIRDGVITYFNEVPVSAIDDQLFDLASVEALAGPQGTLFGRNSTGGAILLVPQKPTDKFEGYLEAGYGNYDWHQFTAVVNLPVNDMLKIRLDGRMLREDPLVTNLIGPGFQSKNRDVGRLSVLFEPTSSISNYTVVAYERRDEAPVAIVTGSVLPTAGCFPGLGCIYGTLPAQQGALQNQLGIRTVSSQFPLAQRGEEYNASNIFTAVLSPDLQLKYILGFEHKTYYEFSSKTTLNLPIQVGIDQTDPETTWTNELQLQGKAFDDRLKWTVGGYDSQQKYNFFLSFALFADPTLPFDNSRNTLNEDKSTLKSRAGYAQTTYALTDKLNLTGGLRYTAETNTLQVTYISPEFTFFGPQVCALPRNGAGVDSADCVRHLSTSYDATTYSVSLDYHVSHDVLLYVTTRRGFNGGGFNSNATNDPGAPQSSYGPETITDYEAGVKSEGRLGEIPVRANLSSYYAKYENIQRTVIGVSSNNVPYMGVVNGPRADIYGLQFEGVIMPLSGLFLNLNYGYLHTAYKAGAPGFPIGNQFAQAPEHTVNFMASYHHAVPIGGEAVLSASYTYQSRITFEDANVGDSAAFQDGYGIADARLSWNSIAGGPVDGSLFVKNLTNVAYAIERQDIRSSFGFVGTVYNDPRTFGLELHYKFGN
jgi:iron complex outermembrane receptor protein